MYINIILSFLKTIFIKLIINNLFRLAVWVPEKLYYKNAVNNKIITGE